MSDATYEHIEQVDLNLSKQTLGVWDCPTGGSEKHLEVISKKMEEEWVMAMKNGHCPSHMAWMAYDLQLWPGIRYVIVTMTNNIYEYVDAHMGREYFSGINLPCINDLMYFVTIWPTLLSITAFELALIERADNYFLEKMQ